MGPQWNLHVITGKGFFFQCKIKRYNLGAVIGISYDNIYDKLVYRREFRLPTK